MAASGRATRRRRSVGLLSLACLLSALYIWPANPTGNSYYSDVRHLEPGQRYLEAATPEAAPEAVPEARLEVQAIVNAFLIDQPPVSVCGRSSHRRNATEVLRPPSPPALCPIYDAHTPIVVLEGYLTFGRTGNQLASLLRAMQYVQDHGFELGIMHKSWAMDVLLQFFFVVGGSRKESAEGGAESTGEEQAWATRIEETLCIKVLRAPEEVAERRVVLKSSIQLFYYQSISPHDEQIATRLHVLRTLFENVNTGEGADNYGNRALDMCAGIDSLFGGERNSARYSVLHLRHFEGVLHHMDAAADRTGCDPLGALAMTPEYVKSILAPLDMLQHPIAIITDGQQPWAVKRLQDDPDIGEMIRLVPKEACWMGGDITLAVTADAFIGSPASTFSGFIAATRVALGYGHNHLFRARDAAGQWTDACGIECLFGRPTTKSSSRSAADLAGKYWMMTDKRYKKWNTPHEISHASRVLRGYASNRYNFGHKRYTGLRPDEVAGSYNQTLADYRQLRANGKSYVPKHFLSEAND